MKYKLLSWDKTINSHQEIEKTGCIIDSDNKFIDNVENLFNKYGNYSDEYLEKTSKYGITGQLFGDNQDHFIMNSVDSYIDEMIDKHIQEMEDLDLINSFLTDEKQAEILNLFKK